MQYVIKPNIAVAVKDFYYNSVNFRTIMFCMNYVCLLSSMLDDVDRLMAQVKSIIYYYFRLFLVKSVSVDMM